MSDVLGHEMPGRSTSREFWSGFYDPTALERFDLRRMHLETLRNPNASLASVLEPVLPGVSAAEVAALAELLAQIGDTESLSRYEGAILTADILEMISRPERTDRLAIIEAIREFLGASQWAKTEPRPHPSKALVEITNNCNLNCLMCGVGAKPYDPIRTMDLGFFHEICESVLRRMRVVRLNGLGESTIVPNFEEYARSAAGACDKLEIVTNLTMEPRVLDLLVELEFQIFVSCDSPDVEALAAIRRNLDTGRFLANLKHLATASATAKRPPDKTQFIMTILETNYRDLPRMVEFAATHRIGGVIANMVKGGDGAWKARRRDELARTFAAAHEVAVREGVLLTAPDQIEGVSIPLDFASESNHGRCPTYLEEAFIRYNGDVCPCNMMNPYVYGNLRRDSMDAILKGAPAKLFDHLMHSRARHPYCQFCYYMRRPPSGEAASH